MSSPAHRKISPSVYLGTVVHTPSLGVLEVMPNCALLVNEDGIIQDVVRNAGPDAVEDLKKKHSIKKTIAVLDLTHNPYRFLFPGFVDTHIHAPQFPNAGIFGNSTLLDWLDTYTFPLEALFKDTKRAQAVYTRVVDHTLRNGTTTALYFATIHAPATNILADICLHKGQRALVGRVCMDSSAPDFYSETHEEMQQATQAVCDHISQINRDTKSPTILPTLTPRFAPSCTRKTLDWLGSYRKQHDLHVQSHVSENVDEIKLVGKLFPELLCYTAVYDDSGLLSKKTVLAHGVHLTDEEILLLEKTGTGISHCPILNSSLTSGETRVRALLDSRVKVGLGTDMSGGFLPLILSTARQAHLVLRHLAMKTKREHDKLSVADVLYLGTMGGALCLDLDKELGTFEVGKRFECQLVDLRARDSQIDVFDWQLPDYLLQRQSYYTEVEDADTSRFLESHKLLQEDGSFFPEDQLKFEDLMCKWLFNGDDRNTVKVFVNGRVVVDKLEL